MAKQIDKIVELLSQWPGIGPRQARRIAFYLASLSKSKLSELSAAVLSVAQLQRCRDCFAINALGSDGLCDICGDSKRSDEIIALVEKETDLATLETTKKFKGKYLVLGSLTRDGILTQSHKQRLSTLEDREGLKEVLIALSPTTYGDVNANAIELEIKHMTNASGWRITRLGRGIPTGAELEFADEESLGGAFENRK